MIVSEFYPTYSTYGEIQLTDTVSSLISSITDIDETFLDPYMMGYILRENMPSLYKPFKPEYDSTTETFVFKSLEVSNIAWGFGIFVNSYQQENHVFPHITGRYENDAWVYNTGVAEHGYGGNITLPNNIFYHKQNSSDVVVLVFTTFEMGTNNQVYGIYHGRKVMLLSEYMDFINGESKLELPTQRGTYEFEYNTIGNMIYNEIEGDPYVKGEYAMFYGLSQTSRQTYSGVSSGVSIQPIFKYKLLTDDGDIPYFTANANSLSSTLNFDYAAIQITTDNNSISNYSMVRSGDYYLGNADFSISKSEIPASQGSYWIINDHKALGLRNGPYQVLIFICVPPEDLLPYFNIFNKIKKSSTIETPIATTTYTTDDFVCLYNSSDVPKNERISGNYNVISSQLRPWQLYNIPNTSNNFDVKDIPEPTPPPGEDKENTGSDIIRPATLGVGGTNGFITQYALTASQIAEIGRLLWLSFANIDYYKNFLFTLTTTGTIDLANLLDYFVSLRVYPFPLINVPSWASAGQDMYIGAGFIPLHFSSTIHTINNYADYIDAGTCEIPRSYGDFRDLTHCEIMLYLPYCGTVQLNPADVVGGTLHAQYAIDFATGGCIAYVDLYTWDGRQFMIAALSGSIGADIPLTATNATQIAARIASNALNIAGTLGNGAAGVAAEVPTIAVGAATGNVPMAAMGAVGALGAEAGTAIGLAQDAMRIATQDAVKMPMMAGGRGFAGFGSPQTAYVQIRRGLYAEGHTAPQGFTQAYGNMYAKPVTVDSCTGFTVFANVDTSGLIAQADERDAIRSLMQSGIYI